MNLHVLWLKVDASRRQSDPRKEPKAVLIIVRPRSKTCRKSERASSGSDNAMSEGPSRRVWG